MGYMFSGIYDGNNFSTVSDIAKMSLYMINNYPDLYKIYSEKNFTWERTGGDPIKQGNRNVLLYRNIGADGVKTGHLSDSGYSLAATTKINERRIISVISGTNSSAERTRESLKLINYAKIRFELFKIPKEINAKIKTWNLSQPKRKKDKIKINIKINEPIKKPVLKNEIIGKANIYFENNLIKSVNLISSSSLEKSNFFKRFMNSISFFVWG